MNIHNFVGKEVQVISRTHPHYGARGKTVRVEKINITGKEGMVVKRHDTGEEFFVFKGNELIFYDAPTP